MTTVVLGSGGITGQYNLPEDDLPGVQPIDQVAQIDINDILNFQMSAAAINKLLGNFVETDTGDADAGLDETAGDGYWNAASVTIFPHHFADDAQEQGEAFNAVCTVVGNSLQSQYLAFKNLVVNDINTSEAGHFDLEPFATSNLDVTIVLDAIRGGTASVDGGGFVISNPTQAILGLMLHGPTGRELSAGFQAGDVIFIEAKNADTLTGEGFRAIFTTGAVTVDTAIPDGTASGLAPQNPVEFSSQTTDVPPVSGERPGSSVNPYDISDFVNLSITLV